MKSIAIWRALAWGSVLIAPLPVAGEAHWVLFADKRDDSGEVVSWPAPKEVSAHSGLDLPVFARYVAQVEALDLPIRSRSRWFNGVSVEADADQLASLRSLAFVRQLQPVLSFRRPRDRGHELVPPTPKPTALDYGPSLEQLAAVNVPALHARDIRGQGVRIAIIDAGFNWTDHAAFAHLQVVAARDFINDDDDVGDEALEPVTGREATHGQNEHGTAVLGVLAGNDPGQLIGVAPAAEYLLAKTDDVSPSTTTVDESELPIEEDRWVAALEWADSLGAQVVNSSLGYNRFDDGTGYDYSDLDGATALTTRAAELAVARGIVIVVAAGNEAAVDWHYITVPADAPGVIAVGAVHAVTGRLASFSSRGPTADGRIKPDVVAPGQSVYTVSGRGADDGADDAFALREYRYVPGTSFASPIVAGASALLLQQNPEWSPLQVADALRMTATDLGPAGPDTLFGWGRIDVARASGLDLQETSRSVADLPFPNPARGTSPTVHFPVQLTTAQDISVALFDGSGLLVDVIDRRLPAGVYTDPGLAPAWRVPEDLASGVYLYRIGGLSFERSGKVAILRGP